jgi:hypothetical protein
MTLWGMSPRVCQSPAPNESAKAAGVDEEELHPGQARFRPAHGLAAEEPEGDEAEERREQVQQADEIGHPANRRGEAAASRSVSKPPQCAQDYCGATGGPLGLRAARNGDGILDLAYPF